MLLSAKTFSLILHEWRGPLALQDTVPETLQYIGVSCNYCEIFNDNIYYTFDTGLRCGVC